MANINDIPMKQYDTDGIKSFSNSPISVFLFH